MTLQLHRVFLLNGTGSSFRMRTVSVILCFLLSSSPSMNCRAFLLISTVNAKSLHQLSFVSYVVAFRYGFPLFLGRFFCRNKPVQHLLVQHPKLSNFVSYVLQCDRLRHLVDPLGDCHYLCMSRWLRAVESRRNRLAGGG